MGQIQVLSTGGLNSCCPLQLSHRVKETCHQTMMRVTGTEAQGLGES